MPERTKKSTDAVKKPSKKLTATEILYLLGETLLLDIDEQAEVEYAEGDEPHSFMFKMSSGRVISVLVMDVIPAK